MKKIFVTSIGGDIGYGVIKSLKKSGHDLYIVGCDIRKYNYSYDLVDKFYISPPYKNEDEWWDFISEVIKKEKINYFWPIAETEIKITDKRKEDLVEIKTIINNSTILEIAMDKGRTAEYLKRHGLNVPDTWQTPEECSKRYPLIVKERFSCGSHGIKMVINLEELLEAINSMKDAVIQEYIGDEREEYTLTVFSDGMIVNYIAFKRILGFGGMSRFVELVNDDHLKEIAYLLAKIIHLKGSINVQMRKRDGEYYIFEINPRISSTIGFRLQLGFNDVSWWIDMLEGKKIKQYIYPNKKIYGVRSVEEKLFSVRGGV